MEEVRGNLVAGILNYLIDNHHQDGILMSFQFAFLNLLQRNTSEVGSAGEKEALMWELRDYLWEKLHSLSWNDTNLLIFREWFGIISALLVVELYSSKSLNTENRILSKEDYLTLLHLADIGLLLSSPSIHPFCRLHRIIDVIYNEYRCSFPFRASAEEWIQSKPLPSRLPANFLCPSGSLCSVFISTINAMDLLSFYQDYFLLQKPVLLTGLMEDWRAPTHWKDLSYFLETVGERTVPIELGSSYLSAGASMKLMKIREFIMEYIVSASTQSTNQNILDEEERSIGYLAQHSLFEQIPILKNDFLVPDHCSFLMDSGTEFPQDDDNKDVLVQSWFGPVSSISPLHYDSYYNILAQVVGYKAVRLYAPLYSSMLRPLDGKMKNNSSLDLLNDSDLKLIENVPYFDIILQPGDSLFIPRWWWHYVLALDYETAKHRLSEGMQGNSLTWRCIIAHCIAPHTL